MNSSITYKHLLIAVSVVLVCFGLYKGFKSAQILVELKNNEIKDLGYHQGFQEGYEKGIQDQKNASDWTKTCSWKEQRSFLEKHPNFFPSEKCPNP